ncbi:hypothetical protein ACWERV_13080 [Streptomyces sp. NPDC004031]
MTSPVEGTPTPGVPEAVPGARQPVAGALPGAGRARGARHPEGGADRTPPATDATAAGPRRRAGATALAVARRATTVPLLLALIPVVAALFAVTALAGAVSLAARRPARPARVIGFVLLYLLADCAGLVAAAALYVRHPPGRRGAREARVAGAYAVLTRLLTYLRAAARPLFGLDLRITPRIPAPAEQPGPPLLVFARHAGPGDSFLVLHTLLGEAGLRPYTVLKGSLRADPCLDVLVSEVPHCFLPAPDGGDQEAIGALAAALGPGDALVLFPEGGNFTPRRHRRAVASLRRHGRLRKAARATRLHYVLPPRDAGVLAALEAAPTADAIFVAHSGLDVIDSVRSVWNGIPLHQPVRAHWWRVSSGDIPRTPEARSEWLLTQWTRVDAWIATHAPPGTAHV